MDAGPIISQQSHTMASNDDDATKILPLLFDIGTTQLLEKLPDILKGKITMEENVIIQNDDDIIEAPLIDSSEGELKVWQDSAITCHNKVRGFSMWPGTFMYFKIGNNLEGDDNDDDDDSTIIKVKIAKSKVVDNLNDEIENTGRIINLIKGKKRGLGVFCHDGSLLEILTLQPVTKNAMDAKSYVNGLRGKSIMWVEGLDE